MCDSSESVSPAGHGWSGGGDAGRITTATRVASFLTQDRYTSVDHRRRPNATLLVSDAPTGWGQRERAREREREREREKERKKGGGERERERDKERDSETERDRDIKTVLRMKARRR